MEEENGDAGEKDQSEIDRFDLEELANESKLPQEDDNM
jgi:hypothetical protein